MKTKLSLIVLLAIMLAACAPATPSASTPDAALISTAAAKTVIANFTSTAAAWTATPLSAPTDTPTSLPTATIEATPVPTQPGLAGATQAALCDRYSWDNATVDVNVPDNTQMTPGQDFVKTWKIKNAGTCTWGAGYTIIFSYGSPTGEKMSGVAQPINGVVAPGQEVEISVQFKAPTQIGEYLSAWTLANSKGIPFFGNDNKPLYVKIVVKI
jgi:hypothetical protein